jgi:hypothetical protein
MNRKDTIFYSRVSFYVTGTVAFVNNTFNLVGGCV